MSDPVCPLIRALYGHPSAGAYWEQHAEKHLVAQGFIPIREWKSCFIHPHLKTFLIIYVDDFKISGTEENVDESFRLITTPSPGNDTIPLQLDEIEPSGRYLGCQHITSTKESTWHGETLKQETEQQSNRKRKVNVVQHDMREFFGDAVQNYCDLASIKRKDLPAQYTLLAPSQD